MWQDASFFDDLGMIMNYFSVESLTLTEMHTRQSWLSKQKKTERPRLQQTEGMWLVCFYVQLPVYIWKHFHSKTVLHQPPDLLISLSCLCQMKLYFQHLALLFTKSQEITFKKQFIARGFWQILPKRVLSWVIEVGWDNWSGEMACSIFNVARMWNNVTSPLCSGHKLNLRAVCCLPASKERFLLSNVYKLIKNCWN